MDEEKKFNKVVAGNLVTRKKTALDKLSGAFFKKDVSELGEYVVSDIVVPAIKDTISDVVRNGIDYLLYGDIKANRITKKSYGSGTATYVNYNSISTQKAASTEDRRSSNVCKEIILSDKGEAEAVLDTLLESVDLYGMVSVGDLYDLVGEATEHTDYKYGWTNLSSAAVVRIREGYLIKLPRTVTL